MFRVTVLIWIFCLELAVSAPTDEFHSLFNDAELTGYNTDQLMGIVPGIAGSSSQRAPKLWEVKAVLQRNGDYIKFMDYVKQGVTSPGRIFNLYDDDMREAATYLFGLIRSINNAGYDAKEVFDFSKFNTELVSYSCDLNMLYGEKHPGKYEFVPPFMSRPNHFINGETIFKAIKIGNFYMNSIGDAEVNQYFKIGNTIVINTNYSGWYLQPNSGHEELNYFREDISLNSYYYGVHLMHPFWVDNQDFDEVHPRHNDHYYYTHQQLLARLLLEKEHIKQMNRSPMNTENINYSPCLVHANGLPFPQRSNLAKNYDEGFAKVKSINIAIKECMERSLIIMANSTTINMTEDNYIDLLVRLIRANYESTKTSKIVRFLFGYGGNGNSDNEYNVAPSLLHYPETSLRDPNYWQLMEFVLNYFTEYKRKMEPYDIGAYETDNFTIVDTSIPKITTYFDYYQFNINKAISDNVELPVTVTARQKRLKHSQFAITFTVESKVVENVIVRLFLGPPCDDCWREYSQFYELDIFESYLHKGMNFINWSPEKSKRLSSDEYYNLEGSVSQKNRTNTYSLFKFPENLLIPRGLENGLNLTLFVIITSAGDVDSDFTPPTSFYRSIYNDPDTLPLGFPFHRLSYNYKDSANNYKFYKILVHHKQNHVASNGYFSPHLY